MLAEKYEGPGNWRFAVKHIIDSYKRIGQLEEYSQTLLNRVYEWESWGDFDPEAIRSLSNRNIFIKLFQIPLKELKNLPQELFVKKISEKAGLVNCVVVSLKEINLPFKETSLPKMSLNQMQSRINKDSHLIETINKDLQKHAAYLYSFIKTRITLVKELELLRVLKGMGQEGKLVYICGYVPNAALKIIETTAFSQRWGFFSREPEEDETVPTLIRNPRWVELINPVFKLLEIIPGYRELDISPLFLCFLSLFFGMIIGDAGYGTVYFLFTLFLQRKLRNRFSDKLIFYLLYLFSSCAIFWGLLTGTVFGQEWYLEAGFKPLLPVLNDTKFLQAFCFFLGAFHLTLAHAWQAIRKAPSVVALSDLGWICVLWAAFFVAKTLILDVPFPFFGKWLIAGGLGLVIFFSNPKRNIVKTIGAGLGTVALSLMNNFTDVVSYIRLFAIGLAGVAIADTVNTLTASLGNTSVAFFGKILIVFLGHTINIVLGPMSVLVHGIRLNVLEFSSHAGLSWGGVAYKPLKS
jgi:V/A-type H+-transporting ATPase subunit I